MLYDRTNGVHHPAVRGCAGFLLVAMLVLGFLGDPPKVVAQGVEWRNPSLLPALDDTSGRGRTVPEPLAVELDGSFPVSTSTIPTLIWRNVRQGVGQVRFALSTPGAASSKEVWSSTVSVGADRTARTRVAAGVLRQGQSYVWSAKATGTIAADVGPYGLTVDQQRASTQPLWSFAGTSVAEGTGELVYTWGAPALPATSGPVGWTLVHRPTNEAMAGLPAGWNLVVSGLSGWRSIELNPGGSLTLTNVNGGTVTYTRQGGNQWQPLVGRFHSAGETTQLAQNADGTFSATDGNRVVTVLSAPTTTAAGYPVHVWSANSPSMQQDWSAGRLLGLTDPVTSNRMDFIYGGSDACPAANEVGFIAAPDGDLCAVADWAGNIVAVFYVDTAAGPQIGRIVSGYSPSVLAQVSDIRWDASGRIVGMRAPFPTTVAASRAIDGVGPADPRLETRVEYDPQGRVAALTAPQAFTPGGAERSRARETYAYTPAFTVRAQGMETPTGYLARAWIDPTTLHVVKEADESGNVTTFAYDEMGNRTRVTDTSTGTVTETTYDRYGRPVKQVGPTRHALTSPTAPKTTIAFDEDEQGRAWSGLAVRYWDNPGFNGAPAGGSTGPQLGGSTVANLAFNWTANPTGGTGGWAARMDGAFVAPADGSYRFENQTTAKLWINGRACTGGCSAALGRGDQATMQVDVVSDGGAAGVKVLVTGPDGKQVPVPAAQLRPGYGLATSSTVRENSGAGTRELVTRFVFDPLTTHLLATVSPTGARQTKTYEDYDPANGHWGRPTSVTDPAGKTTRLSYASAGVAAADCTGSESDQNGALATIAQPDGTTLTQVIDQGGGVAKSTDGVTTSCVGTTEAPYVQASTVQGVGPSVLRTSYSFDGGSPLHLVERTTRAGGPTETEQTFLDSNGMPWQTIDATGTSTVSRWDPYTGRLDRVVETTRDGQQRSTSYTYAPGGGVATIAVDGHVLITNDYAASGALLRSTLANGAVQTFALDQNNNGRSAKTTFPDGTVIAETAEHSPSGRLLSRTVSGPTGSSTFTYDYNADGRLIATKLAGTIPARASSWRNEYNAAPGRNGNRSSKTWTLANGTTQTTDFTYGDGNRLAAASSGRIAGTIEYDAAGRATKIGRDVISYDAAGHVLSVSDGTRTYAFSDNGQTTTLTEQHDGETRSVTAKLAGRSLILGRGGDIEGQIVTVASGVTALLAADGSVQRWGYDDMLGNTAWSSTGDASPRLTHLYAPGGEPISVDRSTDPRSAIDLVADAVGWQSGHGASTLRLATPLVIIGSRVYTPDGGRWLQPDPSLNGSTNAYEYAIGDPINQVDPSGNASWGWLIGAVVATVAGLSIGAITAGVGGGLAAQVAFGVVAGAVSGAGGEVATQLTDNGGEFDGIDWASVGIAAGIGGAVGGIASGLAGSSTKALRSGRNTRALSGNAPGEAVVAAEGRSAALAGARISSVVDDAVEVPARRFSRAAYADNSFGVEAAGRASVTSSRSSVALELLDSVDTLPQKLKKDWTQLDRRIKGPRATHSEWYRSEGALIEDQYRAFNRSFNNPTGLAFAKSLTPAEQVKLARAYLNLNNLQRSGDSIGAARQMEKIMSMDIFAAPPPTALEALPGGWRW